MKRLINIYGEPVTIEQIEAMREVIRGDFEASLGFKVFMFTPVPGLDVLAGLATYAIECGMKSEPLELLGNSALSTTIDWSVTNASKTYVEKVMVSGRKPINLEVLLLRKHIEVESAAKYALNEMGPALTDSIRSIFLAKGKLGQ